MQSAKEKISNMASAAKQHVNFCKAKAEEKAEKATARTEEERHIAEERRKVKEAQAKMELHQEKAQHAADKLESKYHHHHVYGQPQMPYAVAGTNQPPLVGGHGHHTHTPAGATYPPFGGQPTAGATYPPFGDQPTGGRKFF